MTLYLVADNPHIPPSSGIDRAIRRLKFADAKLAIAPDSREIDELQRTLNAAIDFLQRWERRTR